MRDAAAARKAAGLPPGPSQGQPDAGAPRAHWAGSPNTPAARGPAPPHPTWATLRHGNGRAPGPGRGDEAEPQCLSHSPHRHRGSLPCPVGVSALGAVLRLWVLGRGCSEVTETPSRCSPKCGSSGRQCASALPVHPAHSPPPSPETSPAASTTPARGFRSRLLGRQTEAAPAQYCCSSAPEIWPVLRRGHLGVTGWEKEGFPLQAPSSGACDTPILKKGNNGNCALRPTWRAKDFTNIPALDCRLVGDLSPLEGEVVRSFCRPSLMYLRNLDWGPEQDPEQRGFSRNICKGTRDPSAVCLVRTSCLDAPPFGCVMDVSSFRAQNRKGEFHRSRRPHPQPPGRHPTSKNVARHNKWNLNACNSLDQNQSLSPTQYPACRQSLLLSLSSEETPNRTTSRRYHRSHLGHRNGPEAAFRACILAPLPGIMSERGQDRVFSLFETCG